MDNQNYYWKKVKNGKRPVAKRDFVVVCGRIPTSIKKRTVGALFDETSDMDENAWADNGVRVCANTYLKSGTYVSGKNLILEDVSFCDGVFIKASGQIKGTRISSNIRIVANRIDISESVILSETTINGVGDESDGVIKIENSVLSECYLHGNVTVVDSSVEGDIYIDADSSGSPQVINARIKGDCSISGNAKVSGEIFVAESKISGNVVFEESLSARIVRSAIDENAFLSGSKVVIFDSVISKNAKIGGNVIITDSTIKAEEELDYISVSPVHFPLQIAFAEINHNEDIVTFYMGDNKNIAVYKNTKGETAITSRWISLTKTDNESVPAHMIQANTLECVFNSATEENSSLVEWAKWMQKEAKPEEIAEYMRKKYIRFRDEIRLPVEEDNFTLSLVTWSEFSLAAAVLSEKKRGFGFLTRKEILDISKKMSSNIFIDLSSKSLVIKDSPVILTLSSIEAIARKNKIDKESLIRKLKNYNRCIFADFKVE